MVKNKNILVGYKIFFGLLGLSAVFTEIIVLAGRGVFVPANFFSFFTVESNIFAAVVLLVGAAAVARNRQVKHLGLLRGAAALYMVTTGIVFSVLLSGLDPGALTAVPWDNAVLHYIMPFAVLWDWLVDRPKRSIPFKAALVWLTYPIAYLVYSLIRGRIVGWYPYPFLSPAEHGYAGVVVVSVGVAATVLPLTGLLLWLGKRTRSRA